MIGTRSLDGSGNNLTHTVIIDQHGNSVDTDTFAQEGQNFFHQFSSNTVSGINGYVSGGPLVDDFLADALNSGAFGVFNDNYSIIGSAENPSGNVIDAAPRIISNLISDQSVANDALPIDGGIGNPGDPSLFILPFNSWFTFFGQFFDHGLDLIDKGGAGTVAIPLMSNDVNYVDPMLVAGVPTNPLYVPGASNVMYLTRGTIDPVTGLTTNSTAPLVEQSQTYGSNEAWNFYLREYSDGSDGLAVGEQTGRLVTGADGGMATWADIKANALIKGIVLTDADINDIPEPIFNGALTTYTKGAGTDKAFLVDFAHEANPNGMMGFKMEDADSVLGLTTDGATPADGSLFYDNELLDAHYIAGDSRVNENITLTAVHEVFHNEHNRLVEQIEDLIAQQDQIQPGFASQWDGGRIFEAAKLINEMQYQHLVFEEFGRRMSPNITEFAEYDVTINPNISAEFSQAIYRLGHSMLTDNVGVVNAADQNDDTTLINAFLNPLLFSDIGASALAEGATRVEGNQIDEFVVDALRNFLVGLPLDLAALNIARGREVNLGTLNDVRQDIFNQTADASLAPYASWNDLFANLLNPDSIVNYIAAYARQADIVAAREAGDLVTARMLATAELADATFMNGGDQGFWDIDLWIGGLGEAKVLGAGTSPGMLGSTFDFIFAMQMRALQDGDRLYYLARLGGTNILDQIETLTFGDLVERSTGATHTNGDIFGVADDYIELTTLGTPDRILVGPPLNADVVEVIGGGNGNNTIDGGAGNDTIWGDDGDDIIRGGLGDDHLDGGDGNDTITDVGGDDFIRGGAGNDNINAGIGLDLVFGQTGDDTLDGGPGDDEIFGGPGDDTLFGGQGSDGLIGGDGNDMLFGGVDADTLDGGLGDDYLQGGAGADTLVGGPGDNVYDGGSAADAFDGLLGGYDAVTYQNSTMGLTLDLLLGSVTGDANGDTYIGIEELRGTPFNDAISGDLLDNVLVGGGAEAGGGDILDGRDGNDTLYGNAGLADNLQGGLGTDMAVYLGGLFADYTISVSALGDGTITEIATGVTDVVTGIEQVAFDDGLWSTVTEEFVPLVGLSDSQNLVINGVDLDGNLVNDPAMGVDDNTPIPLDGITVSRILVQDPDGIAEVGTRVVTLAGPDAGSFKIIDVPIDPMVTGDIGKALQFMAGRAAGPSTANYEAQPDYKVTVLVDDASGGSAINYTLNINDVNDNRPVITSGTHVNVQENTGTNVVAYRVLSTDLDTVGPDVVYSLVAGPGGEDNADFTMTNGEVRFNASPNFEAPADADTDNIYNILVGAFDGVGTPTTQEVQIRVTDVSPEGVNTPPMGVPAILGTETEDQVLTADTTGITDADGTGPFVYQWQRSTDGGTTWLDIAGAGALIYTLGDADVGNLVRVEVSYVDGGGTTEVLESLPTGAIVNVNDAPTGAPVITGSLTETSVLTADPSSIMDADGPGTLGTPTYQWQRSMDGGATFLPIIGATMAMYTLVAADVANQVRVDVSYTDGQGTMETVPSATTTLIGPPAAGLFTEMADIVALPSIPGAEYFALGGDDLVTGSPSGETIHGGAGLDTIFGNGGMDTLFGDADADMLFGGTENDMLDGGTGADMLFGDLGNDTILGGDGADTIFGDDGAGGPGDDMIFGGPGNDNLIGEGGADFIDGGAGIDVVNYEASPFGTTVDLVNGVGSGPIGSHALGDTYANVENVRGSNFDDILIGTPGDNTLEGMGGADLLIGSVGVDILSGGAGIDTFAISSVSEGGDIVADFDPNGEVLDLSTLFTAHGLSTVDPIGDGILQISGLGGGITHTIVNLDLDGSAGASSPFTLYTLVNVNPADVTLGMDVMVV